MNVQDPYNVLGNSLRCLVSVVILLKHKDRKLWQESMLNFKTVSLSEWGVEGAFNVISMSQFDFDFIQVDFSLVPEDY